VVDRRDRHELRRSQRIAVGHRQHQITRLQRLNRHRPPGPTNGRVHRALQPRTPPLGDRIPNTRRPLAASSKPGAGPLPNAALRRAATLLPSCRVRADNTQNGADGVYVQEDHKLGLVPQASHILSFEIIQSTTVWASILLTIHSAPGVQ